MENSNGWIVKAAIFVFLLGACVAQFQRQTQYNQYSQFGQQQQQQQQQQPQHQPQRQQPRRFNDGQNNFVQQNQFGQQQPSGGGASCPEPNGRFPVASQCDAYIECIDGVGEQKLCPEGLLFNPEARFNYPCGYPIDVQCLGRSSLQPAQPTEDCPHQYGYFKMGDRQNCGQFMNCVEGRSYIFNCPEGLAYNPESYRCDWPDQVADCDAEAFLGFTCPSFGQNQFLNSEARFYKSPNDCQHYYVCVENRPRLQNCGEGHAFNELINACDAAENVTGCEPPQSTNRNLQPVQLDQRQQTFRSLNNQQNSVNQQQNYYNQQNSYTQQQQQQQKQTFGSYNNQQNSRRTQSSRSNDQYSRGAQRFNTF